jgi:hypothetical protein
MKIVEVLAAEPQASRPSGEPTPATLACDAFDRAMNDQWGEVVVNEYPERPDWIVLERITSSERGAGYGSEMLRLLCGICDQHGVTIYADASAYSYPGWAPGLSQRDLVDWYMNNGFVPSPHEHGDASGEALVRHPEKPAAPRSSERSEEAELPPKKPDVDDSDATFARYDAWVANHRVHAVGKR